MGLVSYHNDCNVYRVAGKLTMIDYYKDIKGHRIIELDAAADLDYVAIVDNSRVDISFLTCGRSCRSKVSVIVLSQDRVESGGVYKGVLAHDNTHTDIHIVSILDSGAQIDVDGSVDIASQVHKVSGYLLEEHLILGDTIKLKTLPMLDVRSSDVRASHGARIQRIDDKKLFYMMSKGISKSDARRLMIGGLISVLFDHVRASDEDFVQKLQDSVIHSVYQ